MTLKNAMTVDVEDYFHVAAFEKSINPKEWSNYESRVETNTARLLELFNQNEIKATFFILGWVAERNPELVAAIAKEGHEIACHGYSHQLVYKQSPDIFREETRKAKNILEAIVQQPVKGYRAASYSITNNSKWAIDILIDLGFEYDSSIFPVHHDKYGMPGTPRFPYQLTTESGKSIIEYPISTISLFKYIMPMAGGGYFRLYPYWLSKFGFKKIRNNGTPFVFYLHPWEIDPQQPRIRASLLSRFRHYNNLDKMEMRLQKLITDFEFTTMSEVLEELNLIELSQKSAMNYA
jgi:polysaccharide deacetylase family protein (PEP-CTERM system associated)